MRAYPAVLWFAAVALAAAAPPARRTEAIFTGAESGGQTTAAGRGRRAFAMPLMQSVALFGVFGLGLVTFLVLAAPVTGWRAQWPDGEGAQPGDRLLDICDERNWASGVHGGWRPVREATLRSIENTA